MVETIGIIAGNGRLPMLTVAGLRAANKRIVCVGLAEQYVPELPGACDVFREVGLLRIGQWARQLRRMGAREAIMVGGVTKTQLMYSSPWRRLSVMRPDWRAAWLWYRVLRKDRRSQTVLAAVAEQVRQAGIVMIDSTQYIPDHLAHAGVMGEVAPGAGMQADIAFGWPLLMQMNALEIGQAIAVRHRDVVAVEAVEGTDAMIRRAGELAKEKWVLLKGAGPNKDLRFDVPTVGVETIERLAAAGATGLALDAGRVILIDKPRVLAAADAAGIAVFGVSEGAAPMERQ